VSTAFHRRTGQTGTCEEYQNSQEGNAVEAFPNRHAGAVVGVLSGFDRRVLRGTLRVLAHDLGMKAYLRAVQALLKDFASHAEAVTWELREASEALARRSGRPIRFLPLCATNKEAIARAIARQDGIEQELAPAKACPGLDPCPLSRAPAEIFLPGVVDTAAVRDAGVHGGGRALSDG
jgi:hypothetical protein